MNYVIAVPSYNRAEILKTKTLKMLARYKIDPKCITVFCANAQEKVKYSQILLKETYGKIVVGKIGVMAIRNFITNYYPKNMYVISLDDDIDWFDELAGTPENPFWKPIKSFKKVIQKAYQVMKENNYHMWGIYPNRNAPYSSVMKPISLDLKFLIGHCFGFINQKVLTHINYKEDYERSLEYAIMDGGVVRFNHICAKTKFGIPGGVNKSSKERISVYNKEVEYLILFHRTARHNGPEKKSKSGRGSIGLGGGEVDRKCKKRVRKKATFSKYSKKA